MENFFLQAVVGALRPLAEGASLGRVWQPDDRSLAADLRLADGRVLVVSAEPADPGLYLSARDLRDFERGGDRPFAALVRKRLRGARLESVRKPDFDRVVRFEFSTFGASGERSEAALVAALTGRTANVYLLDASDVVLGSLRPVPPDSPLRTGERFASPAPDPRPSLETLDEAGRRLLGPTPRDAAAALAGFGPTLVAELEARAAASDLEAALASLAADLARPAGEARLYADRSRATPRLVLATFPLAAFAGAEETLFADPSAAADERARRLERERSLASARRSLSARAAAALARTERLVAALDADAAATEGAERCRELAESLLAQVATARAVDGGLAIVDYYDPEQAEVVVEAERGESPQQAAERLFAFHRKARRTREEVAARREAAVARRERLAGLRDRAESAENAADLSALERELDALLGVRRAPAPPAGKRASKGAAISGVRRFVSSDGYEILVGRSSAANDALTFKVAKSSDLWLHAADYPGSHVVVRNPGRADLPHRTVLEAAQLAAFYSEARGDAVVEVRYTPRKFVSKPKGAAPGLVRISSFKTVAVRPAAELDRAE